jgi:hypothetical protein
MLGALRVTTIRALHSTCRGHELPQLQQAEAADNMQTLIFDYKGDVRSKQSMLSAGAALYLACTAKLKLIVAS